MAACKTFLITVFLLLTQIVSATETTDRIVGSWICTDRDGKIEEAISIQKQKEGVYFIIYYAPGADRINDAENIFSFAQFGFVENDMIKITIREDRYFYLVLTSDDKEQDKLWVLWNHHIPNMKYDDIHIIYDYPFRRVVYYTEDESIQDKAKNKQEQDMKLFESFMKSLKNR